MKEKRYNEHLYKEFLMSSDTMDLLIASDEYIVEKVDDRLDDCILVSQIIEIIQYALTTRQRQVFVLRYGLMGEDSHSIGTIARILQISKNTVHHHLKAAINKVKEELNV